MEKQQILKSLGFSDGFLESINDFEKLASTIEVKDDIQTQIVQFPNFDNSDDFILKKSNDSNGIYFIK